MEEEKKEIAVRPHAAIIRPLVLTLSHFCEPVLLCRTLTHPQVKTAPYDHRFPTTNQARYCFTRYNEFHKCVPRCAGCLRCAARAEQSRG